MIIKKEGGFNLSKDWSYARMAHNVAVAGGPDKWLEALNKVAFNNGVTYAKKTTTVPLLATGACFGMGFIIICQKIHTHIKMKKQKQLITEKEEINVDTIDEIKPNNTDK